MMHYAARTRTYTLQVYVCVDLYVSVCMCAHMRHGHARCTSLVLGALGLPCVKHGSMYGFTAAARPSRVLQYR